MKKVFELKLRMQEKEQNTSVKVAKLVRLQLLNLSEEI